MTALVDAPAGRRVRGTHRRTDRRLRAGAPAGCAACGRCPAALAIVAAVALVPDWGSAGPRPVRRS